MNSEELILAIRNSRDSTLPKDAIVAAIVDNTRLQKALESSMVGIMVIDLTGKILFVNSNWANLFKRTVSEMLGQNLKDLVQAKHYKTVVQPFFEKVKAEGQAKGEFIAHRSKDLMNFFMWADAKLIVENGVSTGIVCSGMDLTEQKQQEMDLEKQKKELEEMNQTMIGRELRMVELKNELARLKGEDV